MVHYYVKCFLEPPFFQREGEGQTTSSHYRKLKVPEEFRQSLLAALSSSLFYFWYTAVSNGRDLSKEDILEFPISQDILKDNRLNKASQELLNSIFSNRVRVTYKKQSGEVQYDQFWVNKSKHILNYIDTILGNLLSFSEKELDFVVNFNIKYRKGQESFEGQNEPAQEINQ